MSTLSIDENSETQSGNEVEEGEQSKREFWQRLGQDLEPAGES
jgi:hypothetical protein